MAELGAARPSTGRQEFARGWSVLVGSLVCYALSIAAIPIYTNGVFVTELTQAFHQTRGGITSTWIFHSMVLAPMSPIIGLIADRVGIRIPVAVGLIGMGLAYVLMGTVMHSIGTYVALQMLAAALGAGTLPVIFTRAVNSWFDRARGLALGCVLIGTGFTATFGPVLVAEIITHRGWPMAYLAIGLVLLVCAPVVVWLVRLAPWDRATGDAPATPATGKSLGEALATPVFWIMAVAFAIQSGVLFGFLQHFVPLLTDAGMTKVGAAKVVGIAGIAILVGRFVSGALLDHIFARWVAIGVTAICAAGTAGLAFGGVSVAPLSIFCMGLVMGAEVDLIGFLASRYFGLLAYGRIYGLLYASFLVGAGFSPLWIGKVYDTFHNYQPALYASAVAMVVVMILFAFLPRYAEPARGGAAPQG